MNKRTLVAFYSHSGNTKKLAESIAEKTNGMLLEIRAETVYPSDYGALVEKAKKEIDTGCLPLIKPCGVSLSFYDTILIGTPNWWGTAASPVMTFLKQNHFAGKKLAVFCTHCGGGRMNIEQTVKDLCPRANFLGIFSVYGSGNLQTDSELSAWLQELKLT